MRVACGWLSLLLEWQVSRFRKAALLLSWGRPPQWTLALHLRKHLLRPVCLKGLRSLEVVSAFWLPTALAREGLATRGHDLAIGLLQGFFGLREGGWSQSRSSNELFSGLKQLLEEFLQLVLEAALWLSLLEGVQDVKTLGLLLRKRGLQTKSLKPMILPAKVLVG